jgi:hypothetical protein
MWHGVSPQAIHDVSDSTAVRGGSEVRRPARMQKIGIQAGGAQLGSFR